MTDQTIHDLAVAYAQTKLMVYLQQNPDQAGYDETLRSFVKSYNHALYQIPIEHQELDEAF